MEKNIKRCPGCGKFTYKPNLIGDYYCEECDYSATRRGTENVDRD